MNPKVMDIYILKVTNFSYIFQSEQHFKKSFKLENDPYDFRNFAKLVVLKFKLLQIRPQPLQIYSFGPNILITIFNDFYFHIYIFTTRN